MERHTTAARQGRLALPVACLGWHTLHLQLATSSVTLRVGPSQLQILL